jgi:hypothetical protein
MLLLFFINPNIGLQLLSWNTDKWDIPKDF